MVLQVLRISMLGRVAIVAVVVMALSGCVDPSSSTKELFVVCPYYEEGIAVDQVGPVALGEFNATLGASKLDVIHVKATSTDAAGKLRFFLGDKQLPVLLLGDSMQQVPYVGLVAGESYEFQVRLSNPAEPTVDAANLTLQFEGSGSWSSVQTPGYRVCGI